MLQDVLQNSQYQINWFSWHGNDMPTGRRSSVCLVNISGDDYAVISRNLHSMIIPNLSSRLQFWSGHIYEMNAIAHKRSTSFSCAILMNRLICTVKFLRNWHVWDVTFHFDSWVKSDNTMSLEVYMTDLTLTDVSYMEFAGEILRLRIYCFYAKSYIFSKPSSTVFHKLV